MLERHEHDLGIPTAAAGLRARTAGRRHRPPATVLARRRMFGRVALAGRRCLATAPAARRQPLLLRARALHSLGDVDGVHPPFAQYSHGVVVDPGYKTLFLSGQLGIDADGNIPETAAEQAKLCFGAIKLLLADADMTSKDGPCCSDALSYTSHRAPSVLDTSHPHGTVRDASIRLCSGQDQRLCH